MRFLHCLAVSECHSSVGKITFFLYYTKSMGEAQRQREREKKQEAVLAVMKIKIYRSPFITSVKLLIQR